MHHAHDRGAICFQRKMISLLDELLKRHGVGVDFLRAKNNFTLEPRLKFKAPRVFPKTSPASNRDGVPTAAARAATRPK